MEYDSDRPYKHIHDKAVITGIKPILTAEQRNEAAAALRLMRKDKRERAKNQENITIPSNALIKQQNHTANSPSNALKSNDLVNAWYHGNCEHCKEDFKKKTTWQRFCSKECRDENYFLRTGKKWHGKKTAAA